MKTFSLTLLALFLFNLGFSQNKNESKPHQVILIISEGLTLESISEVLQSDEKSFLKEMPFLGLALTDGKESVHLTLAAGKATHQSQSILIEAHNAGWRTGIVTTSVVNSDKIGSFFAPGISDYKEIAKKLVDAGIDMIIGGGKISLDGQYDELINKGYQPVNKIKKLKRKKEDKFLGIVADYNLPGVEQRGDDFFEYTFTAIENNLFRANKQYFVVIDDFLLALAKQGKDKKNWKKEYEDLNTDLIPFISRVKNDGDALLIIVGGTDKGENYVPVWAIGTDAGKFSGIYNLAEINSILKKMMSL